MTPENLTFEDAVRIYEEDEDEDDDFDPLAEAIERDHLAAMGLSLDDIFGDDVDEEQSATDIGLFEQIMKTERSDNQGNDSNTVTTVIQNINHFNFPDKQGYVYCRIKNAVTKLTFDFCPKCPFLAGSIQGMGVECFYPDFIEKDSHMLVATVINPQEQLIHIKSLIYDDILPADPTAPFSNEEFLGEIV